MNPSVLVVEDDADIRQVLEQILSNEGCSVHQAPDAFRALSVLENGLKPDAIVLDWILPGMTGGELLPILATDYPTIPVIVTTAARNVTSAHARAVIYKPFTLSMLVTTVQNLVQTPEQIVQRGPASLVAGRALGVLLPMKKK